MSGGGLMQLVAYGAQDVYLTANPQVTFFKQLYRRHSNFSMESIEQTFNGVANFGKRVTCTIARNGDLIGKTYLQVTLPKVNESDFYDPNETNPANANAAFQWIPYVGQYLIKSVELEIGGQLIDKHYGDWLHIWNELTQPIDKRGNYLHMANALGGTWLLSNSKCYGGEDDGRNDDCPSCEGYASYSCSEDKAIGKVILNANNYVCSNSALPIVPTTFTTSNGECNSCNSGGGGGDGPATVNGCLPEQTLYVPLEFWFNRHTGLALPLIALQYHEVKVNIEFNELRYLCNTYVQPDTENSCEPAGVPEAADRVVNAVARKGLVAASLYVDYIYLDTEERRRFAQVAHEYLIEQLQFTGVESVTSTSNKIRMSFNHPVKELVWVVQLPSRLDCNHESNAPYNYADLYANNPVVTGKLQLNGHDRFSEREGKYFNYVQPYQHHTASPSIGINVYSFALKPEDHQPSGTCNMSRIDNATLNMTLSPETFKASVVVNNGSVNLESSSANVSIYATNYNVLRIMSGMGGLAYSN